MTFLTKNLLAPKFLLFLAIVYTLLLTFGSFISPSALPKVGYSVSDKLIHLVAHFVFVLVWFFWIYHHYKKKKFRIVLFATSCIAIIYGIIIEILQDSLTKTREGDFLDILANVTGVLIAIIILVVLRPKLFALKKRN